MERDPTDAPKPAEEQPQDGGQQPARPRERVLWNTVAILIGNILASVSQALAMLKMMRHLAKAEWNVFGYLMSWIEVFRVVANFGLDQVAVRLMAIGKHSPRSVLRHLLLLNTCMLGVVMLVIAALSLFLEQFRVHRDLLMMLAGSLLPVVFTQSALVRFQAEHAMDRLIPVRAVSGLIYLGAVWGAAALGLPLFHFVLIYLVYQAVVLFITAGADHLIWRNDGGEGLLGPVSAPLLWQILRQGIPAGLEALVVVLYQRLGVMFLEHYKGMDSVGHYYTALKVSEPLLMIAGALAVSAFPVLSRLAADGNIAELKGRFAVYSLRSLAPSCLFALVLTFFGKDLLLWIKPEHGPGQGGDLSKRHHRDHRQGVRQVPLRHRVRHHQPGGVPRPQRLARAPLRHHRRRVLHPRHRERQLPVPLPGRVLPDQEALGRQLSTRR